VDRIAARLFLLEVTSAPPLHTAVDLMVGPRQRLHTVAAVPCRHRRPTPERHLMVAVVVHAQLHPTVAAGLPLRPTVAGERRRMAAEVAGVAQLDSGEVAATSLPVVEAAIAVVVVVVTAAVAAGDTGITKAIAV
jgi:hypothetical protein